MNRKYEGLIVLTTKSHEGSLEDLVTGISKDMEAEGAKVEKIEQLGRREFANNARNVAGGHYVNYTFSGEPGVISRIQAKLSLNVAVYLNQFNRVA
ncbi:MAG: 30S ribosomal protein S6 [Armatimonadetes bacterium]|nr:30S ribosomal protein S6 [Akkermansiaceae bacterium]